MILGLFFQSWRLRWSIHAANFNPDAFIGYCWGPEHDGTYIVENWWINFIEITRRYTDYIPKINNLMAQLVPDYYWWIHVQVWSIVFSNNPGGLHWGGIHGTPHGISISKWGLDPVVVLIIMSSYQLYIKVIRWLYFVHWFFQKFLAHKSEGRKHVLHL